MTSFLWYHGITFFFFFFNDTEMCTCEPPISSQIRLQGVSQPKECVVLCCVVECCVVLWWLGRLQQSQTGWSHIWITHPNKNHRLVIQGFISAAAPGQKTGGAVGADIADKCLPQLNHKLIDFMSWIAHGEPGAAHRPLFHSKRPLGSAERSQTSTRSDSHWN